MLLEHLTSKLYRLCPAKLVVRDRMKSINKKFIERTLIWIDSAKMKRVGKVEIWIE